jgi:hypothetical protein
MKLKHIFKRLAVHLVRFILFSAAECAILFGLPALATRHPFILLAVSLPVLIQWLTPKRQSTAPPPTAKRPDPIIPS